MPEYHATHVSVLDESPAMLVLQFDEQRIVLMNEDGFMWSDVASDWREIDA